jgi:hypothetical protein
MRFFNINDFHFPLEWQTTNMVVLRLNGFKQSDTAMLKAMFDQGKYGGAAFFPVKFELPATNQNEVVISYMVSSTLDQDARRAELILCYAAWSIIALLTDLEKEQVEEHYIYYDSDQKDDYQEDDQKDNQEDDQEDDQEEETSFVPEFTIGDVVYKLEISTDGRVSVHIELNNRRDVPRIIGPKGAIVQSISHDCGGGTDDTHDKLVIGIENADAKSSKTPFLNFSTWSENVCNAQARVLSAVFACFIATM